MADVQPVAIQLPPLPEHVTRDTLLDVIRTLGLDPKLTCEITLGLGDITATLLIPRESGGDKARITVTIPIS